MDHFKCRVTGANGHDFVPLAPALKLNNTRFIFPHAPIRKITINMGMEMRGWYDIFGFDRHAQQDETGIKHSQTLINQLIENEIEQGISSKRIHAYPESLCNNVIAW